MDRRNGSAVAGISHDGCDLRSNIPRSTFVKVDLRFRFTSVLDCAVVTLAFILLV